MGTDRILRCNPAALHYHLMSADPKFTPDGRIIDPVNIGDPELKIKNPQLASALSIVPGLGRMYAGHPFDGFLSFFLISLLGYSTCMYVEDNHNFTAGITGSFALLFWSADAYGAYRSANR